jgi:hypothetical protein
MTRPSTNRRIKATVRRFDDGQGDEPFHLMTQCFVRELVYNFATRHGHLFMGEGSCTDMCGAIDTFRRIDPGVIAIATYQDGKPDTGYTFRDGDWRAHDLRHWREKKVAA